eukprot:TRINITY_DN8639_c3_g1_i2.p1 TRINITY_DN8639_c3_g1~~TRINITY_DN8639_c3_g1_i2.p1  ORF type:complete len:108 (+),score=32.29 TRINITY_DN8639_c3_g1_i2:64-387(+)
MELGSFSGLLEALDANEAEVFAFLVGCCELARLGALHPILEGDSFSPIQWGSWRDIHPWRLVDWVEEVQDLSRHMNAYFHHILRQANALADGLAREGVFRSFVSFDV